MVPKDIDKSSSWALLKSEAMMTSRVSNGPNNTYLSVSGSGFRSDFGSTTIDGTGGVEDGVMSLGLGCYLFFSIKGVESNNALTSSIWPLISKPLPQYAR